MKLNLGFIALILLLITRIYLYCHNTDRELCSYSHICYKGIECSERGSVDQANKNYYKNKYNKEENSETKLLLKVRKRSVENIQSYLPSPHSELLSGLLLGQDSLYLVPRFNDVLRSTGTIHVVVVSGYNISLVFGIVIGIIGSQYRLRNLMIAEIVTLIYALIAGFEPPVIRAWIMGSIAAWGKYYGRSLESLRLLFFSAIVMIIADPEYIISLSFQLSFLATLSLIRYSSAISAFLKNNLKFNNFLVDDFSTTIAAQILVWPLISYRFGQVSVLSPLVNGLILWTVPLSTVMGGILLFLTFISPLLSVIFSKVVFVSLDIFILTVNAFSRFHFVSVVYQLSLKLLIFYYLFLFLLPYLGKIFLRRNGRRDT
jgi:competence protein ComEC